MLQMTLEAARLWAGAHQVNPVIKTCREWSV